MLPLKKNQLSLCLGTAPNANAKLTKIGTKTSGDALSDMLAIGDGNVNIEICNTQTCCKTGDLPKVNQSS